MQSHKLQSWELMAHILERVVVNLEAARAANREEHKLPSIPSRFDSSRVPGITIYDYLARVHQYADCSESCYILAFIYIDRVLQKNPSFVLNKRSVHRLILTSVVMAIKYSDDIYADNMVYSKIGGVSLPEFNGLEIEMLSLLQFDLFVHPQLYAQYVDELQAHVTQVQPVQSEEMQEVPTECPGTCVQPTASMGSLGTVPSNNEMVES